MNLQIEQVGQILAKEAFHSRRIVVSMFVGIMTLALFIGLLWPKGYTSSTTILVDEKNIIQPLMQGAAVVTEVRDRARLARDIIHGRKVMDTIMNGGGWTREVSTPENRERFIEQLQKRTTVTTVGQNLIRIEFRDDDPERAYRTTQKFAELFIAESLTTKSAESRAAFEFIDKQTHEYHDKLLAAEEQLKELRGANLDARAGTDTDISARLGTIQTRIETSTQDLREAEIRKISLEKQLSGEAEVATALSREGQYRSRIAELQSQLETLRLSYHETYPDIVRIRHQIADLNDAIAQDKQRREAAKSAGRVVIDETVINNPMYQQLRRDLSQTQIQIDMLRARIAEARNQLQGEVERGKRVHGSEAKLTEVTRDYQVNREIYQDLLKRRENARVSMNLDVEKQGLSFRIQEPAVLPLHPSGLRFGHFLLIGLLLGVAVPTLLLYVRLQLDPRIRLGALLSVNHKDALLARVPHMWRPAEAQFAQLETQRLAVVVSATMLFVVVVVGLRLAKVV